MQHARRRGAYVVFEGPHRAGKSVQATMLFDYLRNMSLPVMLTHEPALKGHARQYVQATTDPNPRTIALKMYADRIDVLEREVEPAISEGVNVVQSRNFLSTLELQGLYGGIGLDILKPLHQFAMHEMRLPDLIVLLIPKDSTTLDSRSSSELLEEDALERSIHGSDKRYDYPTVVGWALQLHPELAPRIVTIDAGMPVDDVHKAVCSHIDNLMEAIDER